MNGQPNSSTPPDERQPQKQKTSITQRRRRRKQKADKAVVIAIISAMATIIVGFLGFQPLVNWLNSKLTPTPFVTVTQTLTPVPVAIDTPTILPTFTFTLPPENIDTPTSTLTSETKSEIMTVILQANATEGKSPLLVNFNAKASYVKFSDGSTAACGETHFCKFTWAVYRDSQLIDNSTGGDGVFSYTFNRRGLYFVTTFVCRGEACGDDGVTVEVR